MKVMLTHYEVRDRLRGAGITDDTNLFWELLNTDEFLRSTGRLLQEEVVRLREEVKSLRFCDCGRELGRGHCGVCDNDE